ncbi:hypothetical protein HHX47_DHR7000225 [Lentinula edodes]|nr:hypothetical protein HHX47_DHR7000225 [Lentinula edodes]
MKNTIDDGSAVLQISPEKIIWSSSDDDNDSHDKDGDDEDVDNDGDRDRGKIWEGGGFGP